uniref:SP-RING-type domain-containing protein n=1 Tax=Auxenochlorella protothecoides TaxID=3075 RepID=A0A1D2AAD3_AUXPR
MATLPVSSGAVAAACQAHATVFENYISRFEAVVESIADVATYHQVAQEPSKVEALRRAVHQLAQGEFEAAGVKAKLRDVAYRLPANPDLLKHLSTELQPPTSSEGFEACSSRSAGLFEAALNSLRVASCAVRLDDDIEVEDGNTLALNNICPLSGRQLMDLKRPVQDRIGVVYEEEAVLRYLYDQGGFAKEALCPLAGTTHTLTKESLQPARKVLDVQRAAARAATRARAPTQVQTQEEVIMDV